MSAEILGIQLSNLEEGIKEDLKSLIVNSSSYSEYIDGAQCLDLNTNGFEELTIEMGVLTIIDYGGGRHDISTLSYNELIGIIKQNEA